MPTPTPPPLTWDVFCRVIDNHGDLGVCWRLCADLAGRRHAVRLWVDDASALAWMAPQGSKGVQILPWRDPTAGEAPGDVVIEAFGCEPPAAFVARMAQAAPPPVWINLEYLSAEDYVERSHGLASPQWNGPGRGLTKWFFYPGYTAATGGLLREDDWLAQRDTLDRSAFLRERLGLTLRPGAVAGCSEDLLLLFGYPQPALPSWLDALSHRPTTLLVTPGHSARAVAGCLELPTAPTPGQQIERGALRLHFLPHVSQPDFDRLLWSCDCNFVRGEDSAVRALWSGRPFVWQLYVQDDGAHLDKLDAFLNRYLGDAPPDLAAVLRQAFHAWNTTGVGLESAASRLDTCNFFGTQLWPLLWHQWRGPWEDWARGRARQFAAQPDLVTQLEAFVAAHPTTSRPG